MENTKGNTYVLIDLERSVGSGYTFYWKPNRRGYTKNPEESGKYSEIESDHLVNSDIDQLTVRLPVTKLKTLLEKYNK